MDRLVADSDRGMHGWMTPLQRGGRSRPGGGLGRAVVWILLIGIAVLSRPVGAGAQSTVRVSVSVDSVKIGERFSIALVATHPAGTRVEFPPAGADSLVFGDVTVLDRGPVHTARASEGQQVDSVEYEVTTFALGAARVPVLPVRIVDDSDTSVVGNAPRRIHVTSTVGPNATGLRTPALIASFSRPLWVWMALVFAGLVLVGALAYVWLRARETTGTDEEDEAAAEDPYERAVRELEQLTRRNPNDPVSGKAFYVELTQAVREYLARRVGVKALECTTAELVRALRRTPTVPEQAAERIEPVLERADFVKFAGAKPDPEQSQALLREARGILDSIEAAQRRAEGRASDADRVAA